MRRERPASEEHDTVTDLDLPGVGPHAAHHARGFEAEAFLGEVDYTEATENIL